MVLGQLEPIVRTSDAIKCLREPGIQETLKRLRSREKEGGYKITTVFNTGIHF